MQVIRGTADGMYGPRPSRYQNHFLSPNSEVSMKAAALPFMLSLALLAAHNQAWARDSVLPAGTLLQCTLDEPNFSSATASVGDPVLCYPHGLQVFGQSLFPRGTYIVGHLADDKDPGHFWGKGFLKIEFDRIGLPSADLSLSAKIVSVSGGYRVDKDGRIIGKGHAKRDVVEWMFPPLWPWKVLTLPARGPRPTLKGETRVTMRLMDDVLVPDAASYRHFGRLDTGDSYAHPALYIRPQKKLALPSSLNGPQDAVYRTVSWQPQTAAAAPTQNEYRSGAADHAGFQPFRKSATPVAAAAVVKPPAAVDATDATDANDDTAPATAAAMNTGEAATAPARAVISADGPAPAEETAPATALGAQTIAVPAIKAAAAAPAASADTVQTADSAGLAKTVIVENVSAVSPTGQQPKAKLTLFALRAGTVYAVTDYWRDEDRLGYVLSNGKEGQIDLSELDWKTTTQLNTERSVKVTLREGR